MAKQPIAANFFFYHKSAALHWNHPYQKHENLFNPIRFRNMNEPNYPFSIKANKLKKKKIQTKIQDEFIIGRVQGTKNVKMYATLHWLQCFQSQTTQPLRRPQVWLLAFNSTKHHHTCMHALFSCLDLTTQQGKS